METRGGAERKVGELYGRKDSQQDLGCEREELEVRAEGRRRGQWKVTEMFSAGQVFLPDLCFHSRWKGRGPGTRAGSGRPVVQVGDDRGAEGMGWMVDGAGSVLKVWQAELAMDCKWEGVKENQG